MEIHYLVYDPTMRQWLRSVNPIEFTGQLREALPHTDYRAAHDRMGLFPPAVARTLYVTICPADCQRQPKGGRTGP